MFYGSRQDNQSSMQQRPLFLWFLRDISKIKYSVDGKTVSCWLILAGLLIYNPLSEKYLKYGMIYLFLFIYFICHTNYKKYRKRRRRKKKKKWRGDLTETIGAYERLGLLELPALSANWPFDRNSGVLLCHKPTRTLHLGQVVVLRNRLRRWLNKCVLTN